MDFFKSPAMSPPTRSAADRFFGLPQGGPTWMGSAPRPGWNGASGQESLKASNDRQEAQLNERDRNAELGRRWADGPPSPGSNDASAQQAQQSQESQPFRLLKGINPKEIFYHPNLDFFRI